MSDRPKRIQRKRTKGWKMPPGCVYVGRPTKWGNPWSSKNATVLTPGRNGVIVESSRPANVAECVAMYREDVLNGSIGLTVAEIQAALRGKDLACWCPLTNPDGTPRPCHADVLLELANLPEETPDA